MKNREEFKELTTEFAVRVKGVSRESSVSFEFASTNTPPGEVNIRRLSVTEDGEYDLPVGYDRCVVRRHGLPEGEPSVEFLS